MMIRKHIAIEEEHLKKIEPLIEEHKGNFSAAIRDAIDLTGAMLQRYTNIKNSITAISTGVQEPTTFRDQCLESGRCIMIFSPTLSWLLERTKGIIIDTKVLEDIVDPLIIKSMSELKSYMNFISKEFSWKTDIDIDYDSDFSPNSATLVLTGNYQNRLEFLAEIIALFLAKYKKLGIYAVHRRPSSMQIEFQKTESVELAYNSVYENFGYLQSMEKELKEKTEFWKKLINIFRETNYNMVTVHKNQYEDLLAGRLPLDIAIIECINKKPIEKTPLAELLNTLKQIYETTHVVDRIDLEENTIKIFHSYRDPLAIKKLKNIFICLIEASGHTFQAEQTSNLIILKQLQKKSV